MARFNLTQLRVAILAAFCRAVAPFHKPALVRQIDRRGDLAADQLAHRLFLSHDRKGNCRQQCSGIWMDRILEQHISRCFLDHLAQIHNCNIIGEIFNYRQVVGNKDVGQSQICLQLL